MVDGSSKHNLAGRALAVLLLTSAVTPPAVHVPCGWPGGTRPSQFTAQWLFPTQFFTARTN